MKVAVTGAGGFVGTNLLQLLVEQGHQVRAIDRVAAAHVQSDQIEWVNADILDQDAMQKALGGIEVIYHLVAKITLAQEDPVAWKLNVEGVRTVAEAALAAGVRRMVHCSSIHAYDQYVCNGHLDASSARTVDASRPVYDRSKYAGEQALREVIAKGLDAVICNPTGVYGPVDYSNSRINYNALLAARGKLPAMPEGGFDFVDVRDVVKGFTLAAEKGRTGENYLLGGHFLPMYDLCTMAAQTVGRKGPRVKIPLKLLKAIVPIVSRLNLVKEDALSEASIAAIEASPRVDYQKTIDELGYQPRSAQQTIRDLIAFYLQQGQLEADAR
ncbi:NAD-dependent epimerase/dehydratase family protein [Sinimarinibacterium sp. NLF-5-8]|uniref:NAD-dependent epimerase/dehydratase family protein n=1 Tax=Sinimarinibacterium sp. NLF-5-8 TaxID=2698684 RepID=UPI00137BDE47|nr:NAD-dependent epimerase/dehydratase family protein [Sinimarinibacterium sp. NLF-5-8]QHS09942.1 NAD-dependent epimerase/dehydratase family protein [Sinimarinibacterium sp. NLF-5-8]